MKLPIREITTCVTPSRALVVCLKLMSMVPHFAALSLAVLDITLIPRGCRPESLQRRLAKKELLKQSDWRRRSPGSSFKALKAETGCHADNRDRCAAR